MVRIRYLHLLMPWSISLFLASVSTIDYYIYGCQFSSYMRVFIHIIDTMMNGCMGEYKCKRRLVLYSSYGAHRVNSIYQCHDRSPYFLRQLVPLIDKYMDVGSSVLCMYLFIPLNTLMNRCIVEFK